MSLETPAPPDLVRMPELELHELLRVVGIEPHARYLVGRCPACGGAYACGAVVGDLAARRLWHSVPACERAEQLPPLGFLQWARTEGSASMQRRGGDAALLVRP